MEARAKWIEKKVSLLTNERGHNAVVDLKEDSKGSDSSYTALEMTLMSLGGCISTIYSVIAENKKLELIDIDVKLDAEIDKTISKVNVKAKIVTPDSEEKARKIYDDTMKSCPVGMIFDKAGIEIKSEIEVKTPSQTMNISK